MQHDIERYWQELSHVTRAIPVALLAHVAELLLRCHHRGSTVFTIGNGGSAATASHFACDLSKGTRGPDLRAFRVLPLTDNVPLMTAWANDVSYHHIFAEQLCALVRPGDIVIAISVSGDSPNVLLAVEAARQLGATTIALTGWSGGRLRQCADLTIQVPSTSVEQVEDIHMAIAHSLCVALRARLHSDQADPILPVALEVSKALELGR